MVARRSEVRSGEGAKGYKLKYLMTKHGLRREIAQKLIDLIGNDRAKLNAAVAMLGRA